MLKTNRYSCRSVLITLKYCLLINKVTGGAEFRIKGNLEIILIPSV